MTEKIECEEGCFWCVSAKYVPAQPAPFPPKPYKKAEEILFCLKKKKQVKNLDLCDDFEDFRGDECK